MRNLAAALLLAMPTLAAPADIVASLSRRADAEGVESVNAYLSDHWESAMNALSEHVVACAPAAMSLALRLYRSHNVEATSAHAESLRQAMTNCPAKLLPIVPPDLVPTVCALPDSVTDAQFQAVGRHEVARLRADSSLAGSRNGRACIAAYEQQAQRAALGPWQSNDDKRRPMR